MTNPVPTVPFPLDPRQQVIHYFLSDDQLSVGKLFHQ